LGDVGPPRLWPKNAAAALLRDAAVFMGNHLL
jgi:hypothetical protein